MAYLVLERGVVVRSCMRLLREERDGGESREGLQPCQRIETEINSYATSVRHHAKVEAYCAGGRQS
jgi:hypothetical protein